jgi:hypothetical protein
MARHRRAEERATGRLRLAGAVCAWLAIPLVAASCSSGAGAGAGGAAPNGATGAGGFAGGAGSGGALTFEDAGGPSDAAPSGCDASPPDGGPPHDDAGPTCVVKNPAVTFSGDVASFLGGCTGKLCHQPPTYDSLVGKPATECCDGRRLVDPGYPERSYLLDKIADHDLCAGSRMPLGGPALAPARLQAVADWICAGAKND